MNTALYRFIQAIDFAKQTTLSGVFFFFFHPVERRSRFDVKKFYSSKNSNIHSNLPYATTENVKPIRSLTVGGRLREVRT